jgi:hypothetical protein
LTDLPAEGGNDIELGLEHRLAVLPGMFAVGESFSTAPVTRRNGLAVSIAWIARCTAASGPEISSFAPI